MKEAVRFKVIYGCIGSGKSSFACKQIDVENTFKLGIKPDALVFLYTLRLDVGRYHEERNREMRLRFKASSVRTIADDIASIHDPVLFVDEWSSLFTSTLFWSTDRIRKKAEEIFKAIDDNPNIREVLIVALEHPGPTMFRLYKKLGLWNALLFERADSIVRINYGVPHPIKW